MRHEFGSGTEPGVLALSVPRDIGALSQRQRVLDGMAKSCAAKTFARTTIADIVKSAAISRATFYKHFANKEECFDVAVEAFIEELEEVAVEARSDADSPAEAVEKAAAAVLDWLAAKPDHAKLLLLEGPIVDPAMIGRFRSIVVDALTAQWRSGNGKRNGDGNGKRNGSGPIRPDAGIAFGRAQVLLADYLASGRADKLPDLRNELVYIALLPFVGQERALRQAQLG